jgi:hypothetical protein
VSERYGIEAGDGRATRLQRLEAEFGSDRVKRWADEGMPVEAMGKPRDMRAFREGQADGALRESDGAGSGAAGGATGSRDGRQGGGEASQAGASPAEAVGNVVSSSGTSLDEGVQQEMEAKMGGDFSDVQVHTGSDAAAAADTINARAFTVGNDVAFNKGEYQPGTEEGNKVLAHELAHVRQQTGGGAAGSATAAQAGSHGGAQPALEVSSPDDPAEKEARQVAEQVASMETPAPTGRETGAEGATATGQAEHGGTDAGQEGAVTTGRSADEQVQRGLFEDAAEAVGSAAESVADAAESAVESASDAVDAIAEGGKEIGEKAWGMLESGSGEVWDALQSRGEALVNMVESAGSRAWDILQDGGEQLWGVVRNAGDQIWDTLQRGGQRFWSLLQQNTQFLVNMIQQGSQRAWDILRTGGVQVWNVLQQAGGRVWSVLRSSGQQLWSLLQQNTQLLVNMIQRGGQQAWGILRSGGVQVWQVLRHAGSQAWTILVNTGQRFLTLLQRNTQLLVSMLRNRLQPFWNFVERNAQRLWTLLRNAAAPVVTALLSAGQDLVDFLKRGFDRFRDFLVIAGKYVGRFVKTYGDQLVHYVRKLPQRVIRLAKQLTSRNIPAFFEWLWEGIKQLISDPSGMEKWLASGAKGKTKPAVLLATIIDLTRAAEAWAIISTLFRDGRQPQGKEKTVPESVLGDTVTYDAVRIVQGSSLSDRAFVTGHVINLPPGQDDLYTLVHEFTHVGQYEAVGLRYIPESVHAQNLSDQGYDYRLRNLEDNSFASFNREQQASILADYYGYVMGGDATDCHLQIEEPVSVGDEEISSVDAYFDRYDDIYPDSDGPYKRHQQEYQSGNL